MTGWVRSFFGPARAPAPKSRARGGVSRSTEVAVIGLGRFGTSLAETLMRRGFTVLGIDASQELVQRYADRLSQTVRLDSTDDGALREVEIVAYDPVVVAIGADFEASLMTTAALRRAGVKNVICKAGTTVHRDLLLNLGATHVVLPEYEGGEHLAREIAMPGIIREFDLAPGRIVATLYPPAVFVGEKLRDLRLRERFQIEVLGVRRGELDEHEQYDDWDLRADDILIASGDAAGFQKLTRL